jgi:hypothetical protein
MFTLAPATRWGYFVYPIALVGWLLLTRPPTTAGSSKQVPPQGVGEQVVPAGVS